MDEFLTGLFGDGSSAAAGDLGSGFYGIGSDALGSSAGDWLGSSAGDWASGLGTGGSWDGFLTNFGGDSLATQAAADGLPGDWAGLAAANAFGGGSAYGSVDPWSMTSTLSDGLNGTPSGTSWLDSVANDAQGLPTANDALWTDFSGTSPWGVANDYQSIGGISGSGGSSSDSSSGISKTVTDTIGKILGGKDGLKSLATLGALANGIRSVINPQAGTGVDPGVVTGLANTARSAPYSAANVMVAKPAPNGRDASLFVTRAPVGGLTLIKKG